MERRVIPEREATLQGIAPTLLILRAAYASTITETSHSQVLSSATQQESQGMFWTLPAQKCSKESKFGA